MVTRIITQAADRQLLSGKRVRNISSDLTSTCYAHDPAKTNQPEQWSMISSTLQLHTITSFKT